jgi:hypothetical protein
MGLEWLLESVKKSLVPSFQAGERRAHTGFVEAKPLLHKFDLKVTVSAYKRRRIGVFDFTRFNVAF